LKNKNKVIIFEEVIGLIEEKIRAEAQRRGLKTEIFGKNLMEPIAELNPDRVMEALTQFLNIEYKKPKQVENKLTPRTPRFCTGCPDWSIYEAIKNSVNKDEVVFVGDIGCYMMGYYPPFELQDILLCMGSSLSVAHGISKTTSQKVIAMVGDSTLLHAGLQGIINIVNNYSSPLIIVFNNGTTAMTGQQPHPATPLEFKTHDGKAEINLENLLKAIGIKNIVVLDPVSQNQLLKEKIKEELSRKEASVIICRHPCVYINHLEKMEIQY
jgi:indolepyruvate ferredoxin oxidoreductase alpha subunit